MVAAHISFDPTSTYGTKLRAALDTFERGDDLLTDVRDVMVQMRDGADNPADSANYAEIVRQFRVAGYDPTQGVPTTAQTDAARAMFLEIDTCWGKLQATGATSEVRQAINQLFAKLR